MKDNHHDQFGFPPAPKPEELKPINAPAGTIIHINGVPFTLDADTVLTGIQTNADLAGLTQTNNTTKL